MIKKCSRCGKKKSHKKFYKNSQTKDGYGYYCKECRRSYNKEWINEKDKETNGLYSTWQNMKVRCNSDESYKDVDICEEWADSFDEFYDWAKDIYEECLEIDRISNEGDYTPENCRFVTHSEQMRNREPFNRCNKLTQQRADTIRERYKAEDLTYAELGDEYGVTRQNIERVINNHIWTG